MATLTVLKFPTVDGAEKMLVKIQSLQKMELIKVQDAAIVTWPEGKQAPKTKQLVNMAGMGAMQGAFWGMLFGLLFFVPFLGLAIGAAMGALFGKLGKTGLNKEVLEQMGDAVPPGKAGWFLLIGQMTEDKFLAAVQGTQATLVRSNLSHEQEEELKQAFGTEKHAKD